VKTRIEDLAIFGGQPVFREKFHVGRPNIGNRQRLLARIDDVLDSRWLTNDGPYLQEFERRVAKLLGVRHCIAVANGTVGLEIAIRAAGLTGEVIVPSFTFVATAHSLLWQNITPVFADVDEHTHTLDVAKLQQLITPRTTGILGVHLWGRPCQIDRLVEVARDHHLRLLFDAAHAFACSYNGRMIGGFGDAEVFSFHATKFVNTLEGGAIVTNDDKIAHDSRLFRNFGFTDYDSVESVGTNAKMNEIEAAIGITSLEGMPEVLAVNKRNYMAYSDEMMEIEGISLVKYNENEAGNYQYVVLEIDETQIGISRDQLLDVLHHEGVLARRYFFPGCHRMEPYRSLYPDVGRQLRSTEELCRRTLVLPTGTSVGVRDVKEICEIIRFVASHKDVISNRR